MTNFRLFRGFTPRSPHFCTTMVDFHRGVVSRQLKKLLRFQDRIHLGGQIRRLRSQRFRNLECGHACAWLAPSRSRNTLGLQAGFSRLVRDREKGRRGVRKRPYCPTLGYGRIGTGGWNYATWFPNPGDRWACVEGGNGFASHVPVGQQTCHMRPGTAMARSCCVASLRGHSTAT